jgi:type IV secretion system T-DNA border endonuclease VirD2
VVRRFENQWGERHSPKLGHTSHLLMAFPVGTSGEEVRAITESVCERFFQSEGSQYDYIAAIHQDRAHPHADIVLNRRSKDGEMFFLGKDHHFNYDAFRVAMVEAAQVHGIRLEATRRLDRGVTTYRAEIDEVYKARDEGRPPVERQRTGTDLAVALQTVAHYALIAIGRLDVLNLDLAPMPSVIHAVHLGRHGMHLAVAQLPDWLKASAKRLV